MAEDKCDTCEIIANALRPKNVFGEYDFLASIFVISLIPVTVTTLLTVPIFAKPNGTNGNGNGTTYTLTIVNKMNGTTSPVAGTYVYPENEMVTITAIPNQGYEFGWWTTNGQNLPPHPNPKTIVMNMNYTLEPNYTLL